MRVAVQRFADDPSNWITSEWPTTRPYHRGSLFPSITTDSKLILIVFEVTPEFCFTADWRTRPWLAGR
jgi:hypothetical protein